MKRDFLLKWYSNCLLLVVQLLLEMLLRQLELCEVNEDLLKRGSSDLEVYNVLMLLEVVEG